MADIFIYEYLDIVNPINDLKKIEEKSIMVNKWSWEILIEELKKRVIIDSDIEIFIYKVKKNIQLMNTYYINGNIYKINKVNKENQSFFNDLQIKEIEKSCKHDKFYIFQKNKINDIIDIIIKLFIKMNTILNNKQQKILDKMLKEKYYEFNIRSNIIKKINTLNNNFINYDDDLIINISNLEDFKIIKQKLIENKKIYDNVVLPRNIIEKNEVNNINNVSSVCKNKYSINKLYIHDIIKLLLTYDSKIKTQKHKVENKNYKIMNNQPILTLILYFNKNNQIYYLKYLINSINTYFDLFRKKKKCSLFNGLL